MNAFIRPGEDERVALCTDEFSDISPLTGGNVAFSTLEGRPSAYNFDQSLGLQVRAAGRQYASRAHAYSNKLRAVRAYTRAPELLGGGENVAVCLALINIDEAARAPC